MQFQLVLFGHGSRDREWLSAFEGLANEIRAHVRENCKVRVAFLQFIQPRLEETVKCAVEDLATHIHILPVFLFPGQHVKRDIPGLVAKLQAEYPLLHIRVASPIGEHEAFQRLVIDSALAILDAEM